MFNSTLPSSIAKDVKMMPDILTRRESVEIVAESVLQQTPSKKRKFSSRSKSTRMYQSTLTPSRAFKWSMPVQETSANYFHGLCYKANVTRRRSDLSIETMNWKKYHLVVIDDVVVFFTAPDYEFDSRVHLSAVKMLKRVRISGKSTTYFGTAKPFVVRFQTRSERKEFRTIMSGTIEANSSVNLSSVEMDSPRPISIASSSDDNDDVFLPTMNILEAGQTPRRRIRSMPEEDSVRLRAGSRSKLTFRSLRSKLTRKNSIKADQPSFLDSLRNKSRRFKSKFLS